MVGTSHFPIEIYFTECFFAFNNREARSTGCGDRNVRRSLHWLLSTDILSPRRIQRVNVSNLLNNHFEFTDDHLDLPNNHFKFTK